MRVYHNQEDSLIAGLLSSSRIWCENYLNRALVQQTLLWTEHFAPVVIPYRGYSVGGGWFAGGGLLHQAEQFQLPRPPCTAVNTVTLRDHHGVDTVLTTDWYVDLEFEPALLKIVWRDVRADYPDILWPLKHVQVSLTCGYATDAIPQSILTAIMLLTNSLYERRGDDVDQPGMNFAVTALLDPHRLQVFG
jgi:hypothetical protein